MLLKLFHVYTYNSNNGAVQIIFTKSWKGETAKKKPLC